MYMAFQSGICNQGLYSEPPKSHKLDLDHEITSKSVPLLLTLDKIGFISRCKWQ